ncbi:MAG: SinR family protein [Deltaproteobacteria bacterium]|nr:SinR family protein [Deltaproteobacteria bacterium]
MAVRLIGYDLNKPGKDYKPLYDGIKKVGSTWWHYLDSTWLVVTDKSPSDIRDELKQYIDNNDHLMVVALSGAWATQNLSKECNDWLHQHM